MIAVALLLACVAAGPAWADVGAPPALEGVGIDEHPGALLPLDVPLVDESGRHVTLGTFFDGRRPVLLTLAYFRCPMLCGLVLGGTADAIAASARRAGEDYRAVTVSFDPRDDPAAARAERATFLPRAGLDGDAWPFLVGEASDVARLVRALGVTYRFDETTGQYAHPAALFVVTPDGRVSRYLYDLAHDVPALTRALDAAAAGETGRSLRQVLLQCFQYVPSLRRHAALVTNLLRAGGVAIVLAAAGVMLAGARTRKRRMEET